MLEHQKSLTCIDCGHVLGHAFNCQPAKLCSGYAVKCGREIDPDQSLCDDCTDSEQFDLDQSRSYDYDTTDLWAEDTVIYLASVRVK